MPSKKKPDPEVVPVAVAPSDDALIEHLLSLEEAVYEAARNVEPGHNSDALKAALSSAGRGIAHVRKARVQIESMERSSRPKPTTFRQPA